jgi:hypothetical protein
MNRSFMVSNWNVIGLGDRLSVVMCLLSFSLPIQILFSFKKLSWLTFPIKNSSLFSLDGSISLLSCLLTVPLGVY